MSELENGFRLGDVIALVKRRSAFIVCAAAIGVILGFLIFVTSPTNYSATARVRVEPIPTGANGSGPAPAPDMDTEKDQARSDRVAELIRDELKLDGESNKDVLKGLTVSYTGDSSVLSMTVESTSASRAQNVANAAAAAYLEQSREKITKTVESLNASAKDLSEQLSELQTGLEKAPSATQGTIRAQITQVQNDLSTKNALITAIGDPKTAGGEITKRAPQPPAVLSKMALAKGVGVFGLCVLAGIALALIVDRRDSHGGGRRTVAQIAPGANMRMMPSATRGRAGPAEIDAAIDRLAVELVGGNNRVPGSKARGVLVVGTTGEPPVAMAEELASSLTFAGIPALFVLAGSSAREVRDAQVITSFADLITGPSVTGPASLPSVSGQTSTATPTVTWLRPRGSAEASGLLRRAVIEALVSRAGREGFEAVVFVAATPTKNAAAAALGNWVDKTAVIVQGDDAPEVEAAVQALVEADVDIDEVVWT